MDCSRFDCGGCVVACCSVKVMCTVCLRMGMDSVVMRGYVIAGVNAGSVVYVKCKRKKMVCLVVMKNEWCGMYKEEDER